MSIYCDFVAKYSKKCIELFFLENKLMYNMS